MFVSGETVKLLGKEDAKVIVCHIGNGASISASIGGKCVDTSMGLTPLEGLVMGTRSGDVDPAVLQFICNHEDISVDEMLNILNKKSGLLGISGVSSDFRDVRQAAVDGNERAQLAMDTYKYRVAKYIGSYTAAMNGVDAITFTAGVGENAPDLRKDICDYLGYLGVELDEEKNENVHGETTVISTPESKVKVIVLAFLALGFYMTPRVLVDSNGIMLTIGTFQVSGLLLGNGNSCPADFFDQLRRRFLNPNGCSLHYHTSNGSTYSLNGRSTM